MKKSIITMLVLIAWATSLPAQTTREQADEIVFNHIQNEATSGRLYIYTNTPSEEDITLTTANGEKVKAKYPCWIYCLSESEPARCRYLLVKRDDGSLLEIIANNDLDPGESVIWKSMEIPTSLTNAKVDNSKLLYPNPVGDLLTLPCAGDGARVEIYDLKGTRLFSGMLSGKDACQLNVSFLSAGVYVVCVDGERHKLIKN